MLLALSGTQENPVDHRSRNLSPNLFSTLFLFMLVRLKNNKRLPKSWDEPWRQGGVISQEHALLLALGVTTGYPVDQRSRNLPPDFISTLLLLDIA